MNVVDETTIWWDVRDHDLRWTYSWDWLTVECACGWSMHIVDRGSIRQAYEEAARRHPPCRNDVAVQALFGTSNVR